MLVASDVTHRKDHNSCLESLRQQACSVGRTGHKRVLQFGFSVIRMAHRTLRMYMHRVCSNATSGDLIKLSLFHAVLWSGCDTERSECGELSRLHWGPDIGPTLMILS